jgi:16S rRNA processing protein RimM
MNHSYFFLEFYKAKTELRLPEYISIGKIVAAHGLKGELLLEHQLGKKTSLKGLKTIFTEEKTNSFLPWFIESTRIKSDTETWIKLEQVDAREAALRLVRRKVWLMEDDQKKFASRKSPTSVLGYMVIDKGKPLGQIEEVYEQPHQLVCRIAMNGKEVLIPLHEESLKKIDHRKKELHADLPDGLLDVYLD